MTHERLQAFGAVLIGGAIADLAFLLHVGAIHAICIGLMIAGGMAALRLKSN